MKQAKTFYAIHRTTEGYVVETLTSPEPTIKRLAGEDGKTHFANMSEASKASNRIKHPRQYLDQAAFNRKLKATQRSHAALQAKLAAWENGDAL